jgi:hypothetical protein
LRYNSSNNQQELINSIPSKIVFSNFIKAIKSHYSFTTPDLLTNCILEYLKYRKRCGEKLNDKSPLIRDDFIIDDLLHIENPRTLALISYVMHLRNILIKTGLIIITPITSSDTLEKTKKRGVSKSWPPQVHAYTYDKC